MQKHLPAFHPSVTAHLRPRRACALAEVTVASSGLTVIAISSAEMASPETICTPHLSAHSYQPPQTLNIAYKDSSIAVFLPPNLGISYSHRIKLVGHQSASARLVRLWKSWLKCAHS